MTVWLLELKDPGARWGYVTAYSTPVGALDALYDYCLESWRHPDPAPDDKPLAIEIYFRTAPESYRIISAEVDQMGGSRLEPMEIPAFLTRSAEVKDG